MKWLKWFSGIAVAAVAVGLVLWAADLGGSAKAANPAPSAHVEDLVSQKTGYSLDTIHKFESAVLAGAADKESKAGAISAAQANALRNVTLGPVLDDLLQGTAPLVGTTPTDLFNSLAAGNSLAQVAQAHNISPTTLNTGLSGLLQSEISKLQTLGVISPAQAPMLNAALASNLSKIINSSPEKQKSGTPGSH